MCKFFKKKKEDKGVINPIYRKVIFKIPEEPEIIKITENEVPKL